MRIPSEMKKRLADLEKLAAVRNRYKFSPEVLVMAQYPKALLLLVKEFLEGHPEVRLLGKEHFKLAVLSQPGCRWSPEDVDKIQANLESPEGQTRLGQSLARSCLYAAPEGSGCNLLSSTCRYSEPCEAGRLEIRLDLRKRY